MIDIDAQLTALTSLLLGRAALTPPDLASLVPLARTNVVLVRLRERAECSGLEPGSTALRIAADEEKIRIGRTVELIGEVVAICERAGIPHVFPKAFQHYPDMGHDIDLLVGGRAHDVDRALLERLGARRTSPGAFDRIAGKTGMWRDGWPSPIEVHHERLGQVGEQTGLALEVLANRRQVTVAGVTAWVPSPDDEVLVQAYQRVCCHLSLRVSDVVKGAGLMADRSTDWSSLSRTASRFGIDKALRVYVDHVTRIVEWVDRAATGDGEGSAPARPPTRSGQYSVALGGVLAAYAVEILRLVARADWDGLMRLSAAPIGLALARARTVARVLHLPSK